jgi:hypothetical protein
MVIIPDLLDVGEEEVYATIAAAPVLRNVNILQSIGDLENEIENSDQLYTQVNGF